MYRIVTVSERDLPEEHDWAMVECDDGTVLFIVKDNVEQLSLALAEGWAAYRLLLAQPRIPHLSAVG